MRLRSILAALAVLVAGTVGGAVVAPATAASPGGISGTVTGPQDELVPNILVMLSVDGASAVTTNPLTAADGTFAFADLAPGNYTVAFEDGAGDYAPTSITVTVADTVVVADVELELAGRITGSVTDDSAVGVAGIVAVAHPWDATTDSQLPVGGYSATTAADGTYGIKGLPPGTYRVEFVDPDGDHVPEWTANLVVPAGIVTDDVDAVLAAGHHIVGTVTAGGIARAGIMVSAYVDDRSLTSAGFIHTSGDGTYDLGGLPAGDYRVCFDDPASALVPECFDDMARVEDATVVHVLAGEPAPQVDADLAVATHIAGLVTDSAGDPAVGVQVVAYRASGAGLWSGVATVPTDATGAYDLIGLAPGVYRVGFAPYGGSPYAAEFWAGAWTVDSADDVDLSDGSPATGIDAQLATAGRITGTVTGPGGTPLAGIFVSALPDAGNPAPFGGAAMTDSSGHYDLGGLPAGDYRVAFNGSAHGYADELWPDVHLPGDGEPVTVDAGAATPGIDAQLEQAGQVSGTVTGPDGSGVAQVLVIAHRWDPTSRTWTPASRGATQPDGTYVLAGLLPDTYRVGFLDLSGTGYAAQYWSDASTVARARDIEVTAGDTETGIDARLARPATPTPTISNLAAPTISGAAVVGGSLTADPGRWSPGDGLSYAYRWQVDGVDVADADKPTYVPTTADLGKRIRVRVTATRPGYGASSASSPATEAVVARAATILTGPRLLGSPTVGVPVGALPGTWSPATASAVYRWLVDGAPVAGATGPTYRPRPADVGRALRLEITVTAPGLEPVVARSPAARVLPGTIATRRSPRLVGRAEPGTALRVQSGRWQPGTVATTYRWFAGGTRLDEASGARLRLTRSLLREHVGQRIRVVVTIRASGYRPETLRLHSTRLRLPQG